MKLMCSSLGERVNMHLLCAWQNIRIWAELGWGKLIANVFQITEAQRPCGFVQTSSCNAECVFQTYWHSMASEGWQHIIMHLESYVVLLGELQLQEYDHPERAPLSCVNYCDELFCCKRWYPFNFYSNRKNVKLPMKSKEYFVNRT